jgi:hypothetical protein
MSSKGHDFILEAVQMKMKQLGCKILASDSHYRDINPLIPPTILNHRPDSIGYNSEIDLVCIGEAKYYGDLSSNRSHTQIKDFINLADDENKNFNVVFGIPASEENHFLQVLNENDLKLNDRIVLLKIPDRLIPMKEDEKI